VIVWSIENEVSIQHSADHDAVSTHASAPSSAGYALASCWYVLFESGRTCGLHTVQRLTNLIAITGIRCATSNHSMRHRLATPVLGISCPGGDCPRRQIFGGSCCPGSCSPRTVLNSRYYCSWDLNVFSSLRYWQCLTQLDTAGSKVLSFFWREVADDFRQLGIVDKMWFSV